jgi:hypothetical protein
VKTAAQTIVAWGLLFISFSYNALASTPSGQAPASLRETGLYRDFGRRVVDPQILAYAPQYPLWTDGAAKHRWIEIPEGTSIDARNPDDWQFPIGTKIWKEFSFGGPAETRYMELRENGQWIFAAYIWNADSSDAVLAPTEGVRNVTSIASGVRHDVPGYYDCLACHSNRANRVLGFNALQLSSDRDQLALHSASTDPSLYELPRLIEEGIVRGLPEFLQATPPRILGASAVERAALGYLYGNCSHCHNRVGKLASLDLSFDVPLQAVVLDQLPHRGAKDGTPAQDTITQEASEILCGTCYEMPALATTIGCEARIGGARSEYRIIPGDPSRSALWERISTRSPQIQMPPLGTELLDTEGLSLIKSWILELEPDPHLCSAGERSGEFHASAPPSDRIDE